jgi:paraquat-inducible protein B
VIAPADKALLQKPGVVTVTLNAPESYGIEAGQPLILHGVQVGQVLERSSPRMGCNSPSPSIRNTETWYMATVNSW